MIITDIIGFAFKNKTILAFLFTKNTNKIII